MSQALVLGEPLVLLVLLFGVPFVLLATRSRLRQTSPALRAGVLATRVVVLGSRTSARPTKATGKSLPATPGRTW